MKVHQTFRLEKQLIESAKKYAESENRTLSNVYETAVINYLNIAKKLTHKRSKQ